MMRRPWLLSALLGLLGASAPAGASQRHESEAERLHRHGVQCMDVIERDACAIENFEALVDIDTTERELVTDAMLRLIKLYDRQNDDEDIRQVIRKFWDAGMKWGSRGHVPYSTRFLPEDMTILFNVDMDRIVDAPVLRRTSDEMLQIVTTCNEAKRANLRMRRRWRRAEREAKKQKRPTFEVLAEDLEKQRERAKKAARRRGDRTSVAPIFSEATCPVVEALGDEDVLGWRRVTGAMNHRDFGRSIALAEIPDLDRRIEKAVAAGRLRPLGEDRWRLPGVFYLGDAVDVARLDKDELTLASAAMMDDMVEARRGRRRRLSKDMNDLVNEVPRDTGFFFVMTADALGDLGIGTMRESTRKFLRALLPRPKGLQVAGVFHEYAGLFTRLPTDSQIKGRLLVNIANRLIDGSAEQSPEMAQWLSHLDVAETEDRRALLASYVLSGAQLEKLQLLMGG